MTKTKRRSCEGKRRYLTRTSANRARSALIGNGLAYEGQMTVYECAYCGGYHLGAPSGEAVPVSRSGSRGVRRRVRGGAPRCDLARLFGWRQRQGARLDRRGLFRVPARVEHCPVATLKIPQHHGVGRHWANRPLRRAHWRAGALGQLGAALPYVPADEVADHGRAVPCAYEPAEGCPQLVFDPDGPMFGVGLLHTTDRIPCIYKPNVREVAVYIHDHYRRGYTRWDQVPWQIGNCECEPGGLFRMRKICVALKISLT